MAIECQGKQHFEPVDFAGKGEKWAFNEFIKTRERDNKKEKLCEKNNTKILYYSDLCIIDYPYKIFENKTELLKEIKNGRILQN